MDTASAPSASAFAASAPWRMPPDTMSCTLRCMSSSCSASTAWRTAGRVGTPACSMKTSWVAAVPPCIPSTTTASAPALTARATSYPTRAAPIFT